MENLIPKRLTTLGHPQRLAIFRLLMRRYPDTVSAGDIATALSLKASTLSAYLNALMQADLVTQSRVGTSLRYSIAMDKVRHMLDYLVLDCCRGRPDLCKPILFQDVTGPNPMTDRTYNVLFICTGNSARSIFAESILNKLGEGRFKAYSAGTRPRSELNPFAVEVLKSKGHDVSMLRSKTVTEFQGPDSVVMDFVFTVCDSAADEECPAWDGQPISGHWGLPDPVKTEGTDAQKSLSFQETYGALHNRISAFTALPIDALDRISLQLAVDDLAKETTEATS
ncbi:arsenate reductase/protein-tyrosine-phosphatase family protein [Meridianimarinicoccus aquatilis]|uniref:ArsR family transcriptional regulator n=1 Tax=Meridianimarinicoccus aquatilis TaxID=2552766 RepID=A0A4R6ANU8_9RHOB|nr:helix-turn-helix domain-containing protein [Fluviibacterium aquatile]TDL85175.1 ArsR family transcriptional regulator [Fluviibacterium aquatile]